MAMTADAATSAVIRDAMVMPRDKENVVNGGKTLPASKVSLAMRSRRGTAPRGGCATAVANTKGYNQLLVDS